jgi:divalent metal cation (Fe/Co/Zn/Cd) transporter
MHCVIGITACSIGIVWETIALITQKDKSRNDIIVYVIRMVCYVIVIISLAMQMRFNSLT